MPVILLLLAVAVFLNALAMLFLIRAVRSLHERMLLHEQIWFLEEQR